MTNTSDNSEHFSARGLAIQSQISALVQSQAANLAVETEFSGEDILKILLGAQIFSLVDFVDALGLPHTVVYDILGGAFELREGVKNKSN